MTLKSLLLIKYVFKLQSCNQKSWSEATSRIRHSSFVIPKVRPSIIAPYTPVFFFL